MTIELLWFIVFLGFLIAYFYKRFQGDDDYDTAPYLAILFILGTISIMHLTFRLPSVFDKPKQEIHRESY
jgi:hypothetical protein